MIISSQKHLFDIPDSHAYLNTAYMSPLMHSVVEAMHEGLALKQRPWAYTSDQFFTYVEDFRALTAQLFGIEGDNMAIVPSASYGLQIAANALPLEPGQTILVCEDQFPSNIYPWQHKAGQVDEAQLVIIPTPEDYDWTAALLDKIDTRTAIVAVPHVHWTNGAKLDLVALRAALDKVDGALVLDLTQSLGAMPFDVDLIRPDFAVAATYKWLMGPYSLGALYIDPKWQGAEPLEHNWMNREGAEDFTNLTHYRDGFQPGARRFDMGGKSNPSQLMGASTAIRQILDWGVDNIAETLAIKTRYMAESFAPHLDSASTLPDALRGPHYLGLEFDGGVPDGLPARLARYNIFISVRGSSMRVTPHLYSTEEDIERFIKAMR